MLCCIIERNSDIHSSVCQGKELARSERAVAQIELDSKKIQWYKNLINITLQQTMRDTIIIW